MSKKTTYLLGILLTIIVGTLLYCYLCDSCYCCLQEETEPAKVTTNTEANPKIITVTRNAFVISEQNGDFKLNVNDNFNFKTSSYTILDSLSPKVEAGVIKLKEFLLKNPLKTIDITGFYGSNETNNSAFPNLGLARANSVKNYFVTHGIPAKQIDTYGKLNDSIVPDKANTLFGPVSFNMLTHSPDEVDEKLLASCDSIRKNPIILHFKTGQAQINLTPEQRQKIADISHCVDKLGVKILVVGHTDNTGDPQNNVTLGQGRADFAKSYLVRNGILSENIETSSKGHIEPIATNATAEGRAKNRRTVITIN